MSYICIVDDLPPEIISMLQAFYSRSPKSIRIRLEELGYIPNRDEWIISVLSEWIGDLLGNEGRNEENAKDFERFEGIIEEFRGADKRGIQEKLEMFYVNYGHKSIGDCGYFTIFIEDVSILAAKVIQDNPLYSGQEASTRYMDFSVSRAHSSNLHCNPYGSRESGHDVWQRANDLLDGWFSLYTDTVLELEKGLYKNLDRPSEISESRWGRAIKARSFDIARSLLPIGTRTNLSWTTNLRQAADHCVRMWQHPSSEIQFLATQIMQTMRIKYPHSFRKDWIDRVPMTGGQELSFEQKMQMNFWRSSDTDKMMWGSEDCKGSPGSLFQVVTGEGSRSKLLGFSSLYDISGAEKMIETMGLRNRNRFFEIPRIFDRFGSLSALFDLDFGSFRDIQRHRPCYLPIPLVENVTSLHSWYLEQMEGLLSGVVYGEFRARCGELLQEIPEQKRFDDEDLVRQMYLSPLGASSVSPLVASLKGWVYISEIRTTKHVHPTLREVAILMFRFIERLHPDLARGMFCDLSDDEMSIRRGDQDIFEKGTVL